MAIVTLDPSSLESITRFLWIDDILNIFLCGNTNFNNKLRRSVLDCSVRWIESLYPHYSSVLRFFTSIALRPRTLTVDLTEVPASAPSNWHFYPSTLEHLSLPFFNGYEDFQPSQQLPNLLSLSLFGLRDAVIDASWFPKSLTILNVGMDYPETILDMIPHSLTSLTTSSNLRSANYGQLDLKNSNLVELEFSELQLPTEDPWSYLPSNLTRLHGRLVYVNNSDKTLPRPENWTSLFPALNTLGMPFSTLWPEGTPSNTSLNLPLSLTALTVLDFDYQVRERRDPFLDALGREPCRNHLRTVEGISLSQSFVSKLPRLGMISYRSQGLDPILDYNEYMSFCVVNHPHLTILDCNLELESHHIPMLPRTLTQISVQAGESSFLNSAVTAPFEALWPPYLHDMSIEATLSPAIETTWQLNLFCLPKTLFKLLISVCLSTAEEDLSPPPLLRGGSPSSASSSSVGVGTLSHLRHLKELSLASYQAEAVPPLFSHSLDLPPSLTSLHRFSEPAFPLSTLLSEDGSGAARLENLLHLQLGSQTGVSTNMLFTLPPRLNTLSMRCNPENSRPWSAAHFQSLPRSLRHVFLYHALAIPFENDDYSCVQYLPPRLVAIQMTGLSRSPEYSKVGQEIEKHAPSTIKIGIAH